ncbi:MAG TPA: co-chaperone GroES [Flavobacteriales bacterium]|jgi:chaperonin GroES|nr:co-chaperone GroES [Flavobacteriales bacterium]
MQELQPVNQNVILEIKEEKEQRTASGLYIPDTAKEKPQFAKVVALSTIESPEVSVGDTVFFKQFSGNEIEMDGKKYLVIQYSDILAKIVETEAI